MNIESARRKREVKVLVQAGWTAVAMPALKYPKGVDQDEVRREWLKTQQVYYKWLSEHVDNQNFKYVHPSTYVFKNKSDALIFKLTWGGR